MVSSPGFVSNMRHCIALFRLGFPAPTTVSVLSSPRTLTRWLILLKARRQNDLSPLRPVVSTQFQILFHSPRRGSFHLSLTVLSAIGRQVYSALERGRPRFMQDFTCPALLRIPATSLPLRLRDSHPLRRAFPDPSASGRNACASPSTPPPSGSGLG